MGKGVAYPPARAHRAGTPLSTRPWPPACLVWFKGMCLLIHHLKTGGSSRTLSVLLGHYSTANPTWGRGQGLCLMGRAADLQDGKFWRSASQQPEYTRSRGPTHSGTVSVINMLSDHN